jgi:hypothetical protein
MRRAIGALVLFVAIVLSGACSADDRAPDTAGPTPSGATGTAGTTGTTGPTAGSPTRDPGASLAPIPTVKAGGNAAAVCTGARRVSETGTTAYIDQLTAMLQAQGGNDAAGAKAAQTKLEQALDTWSGELRRLAKQADDAQLKAVLTELGGEVDKMEATIDSVDDGRLGNIQDRLDALCPN